MNTLTLELPEELARELQRADKSRLRTILEWGLAGPSSLEPPHIVRIPAILGGRPVIRGTRIPVWQCANAIVHLGETVEAYQADHSSLTRAQIHAALSYYFDHEAEIEAEIESNQVLYLSQFRE